MKVNEPLHGPIVFLVTQRVDKAFDAVYPETGGSEQRFTYNILCLEDRAGNEYIWAQQQPTEFGKSPFGGLWPGRFIDTKYVRRDALPGAEQHWHVPRPTGQHIHSLDWRFAKKTHCWPTDVQFETPDRSELNSLMDSLAAEYQQSK